LLGLNLPSQPTFADSYLLGDEYLLGNSRLRNHRRFVSRLSAHHMLSPWTLEEIQTYLTTGLASRGHSPHKVFEPAAVTCGCAPRRRAAQRLPFGASRLLEAARAEGREIWAPTMQLAMDRCRVCSA